MTSAAVSRLIKEEMLTSAYPDVYASTSTAGRRIKKAAPRGERKVKVEIKDEVKREPKREGRRRGRRRRGDPVTYEDEVEFVRTFAPRRPYQWKGRRVRKVLRPGVVVSFTPGQRSGTATKRSYDEVYADEDILQQAAAQSGEFAYGKRARLQAMPLDVKNETPGLMPITPQVAVPLTGKRRSGDLQPTVQLMVPSKRKRSSDPSPPPLPPPLQTSRIPPAFPPVPVTIKDEDMADVGSSGLFIPAIKPRVKSEVKLEPGIPMDVDKVTVRPIKKVAPDMGIQTVDVALKPKTERSSVGTMTEAITEAITATTSAPRKGRPKRAYGVRYHPSIVMGPPVKRTRRRKTTRTRRWRAPATTSRGVPLPTVIYHPSIRH